MTSEAWRVAPACCRVRVAVQTCSSSDRSWTAGGRSKAGADVPRIITTPGKVGGRVITTEIASSYVGTITPPPPPRQPQQPQQDQQQKLQQAVPCSRRGTPPRALLPLCQHLSSEVIEHAKSLLDICAVASNLSRNNINIVSECPRTKTRERVGWFSIRRFDILS